MSRRFRNFADENRLSAVSCQLTANQADSWQLRADSFYQLNTMVTELLIVWIVGVVAFFVLWAILLKVIKRISEKKSQTKEVVQENGNGEEISPKEPS